MLRSLAVPILRVNTLVSVRTKMLTSVLLNPGIYALSLQDSLATDQLATEQLIWIFTVCHKVSELVLITWLAENQKLVWHFDLFSRTRIKYQILRLVLCEWIQKSSNMSWIKFSYITCACISVEYGFITSFFFCSTFSALRTKPNLEISLAFI